MHHALFILERQTNRTSQDGLPRSQFLSPPAMPLLLLPLLAARYFFARNSHRSAGHPAYDFRLGAVVKSTNILVSMSDGNYDQLTPSHLTPTTDVTVSEIHEVDRPVELRTR